MQFQVSNFSGISVTVSGVPVITSVPNTGTLTGVFYPLNSNPAGYITSTAGGTSLQVTGSYPFLTGTNLSGIGGTIVLLSGGYLLISGGNSSSVNTGVLTGVFAQLYKNNTFTGINIFSGNISVVGGNKINFVTNSINDGNLLDANSNPSVLWNNYQLWDGSNESLDWGNYELWFGSFQRANWGVNPQLYSLWQFSQLSGFNLYSNTINLGIKTVTGNYTLTNSDFTVMFSGNNITGFLPSAILNSGIIYDVVNLFGNVVISGSQNINASNIYSDLSLNKGQQFQSNGTQWWIIRTTPTGGLTGQFYPLSSNPNGYITGITGLNTGNFITNSQTGNFAFYSGILSKSIDITTPTTSDNFTMFYTYQNIVVKQITIVLVGSNNPTGNVDILFSSGRNLIGTEILPGGFIANSPGTGNTYTNLTNTVISGGNFVWIEITGLNGTVSEINTTLFYNNQ